MKQQKKFLFVFFQSQTVALKILQKQAFGAEKTDVCGGSDQPSCPWQWRVEGRILAWWGCRNKVPQTFGASEAGIYFLIILEAGKSDSKASAGLVSSEASLRGL